METIKVEQLRKVFYKKINAAPRWEQFYTMPAIIQKCLNTKSLAGMNKAEYQYIQGSVRNQITPLMASELKEQGRFLVAVKRPNKLVMYGFTRERDKILNYISRRSLRDRNIVKRTAEIIEIGNGLMDLRGYDKIDNKSIAQEEKQLFIDYKKN